MHEVFILRSHKINKPYKLYDINIVVLPGVSTSGCSFKHPGRVGDSPLPGSGLYADDEVHVLESRTYDMIIIIFLPQCPLHALNPCWLSCNA